MLSFIILGASFVAAGRNYALRERQNTIEANAYELSRLASAYTRDGRPDDWSFRIILSTIGQSTGNHCFVTSTDGEIVTCSDADLNCGHLGSFLPESILSELNTNYSYSGLSDLDGLYDSQSYVAGLPVVSPRGTVLAYVFAASSFSGSDQAWRSLLNIFLVIAFSIMVLALILIFFSAKVRARPVN